MPCPGSDHEHLIHSMRCRHEAAASRRGSSSSPSPVRQGALSRPCTINRRLEQQQPTARLVALARPRQAKSIAQIAHELSRLQDAASNNTLRPDDIRGGTFTLSNIGTIGGTYATPLVNFPEVPGWGGLSLQCRWRRVCPDYVFHSVGAARPGFWAGEAEA